MSFLAKDFVFETNNEKNVTVISGKLKRDNKVVFIFSVRIRKNGNFVYSLYIESPDCFWKEACTTLSFRKPVDVVVKRCSFT